MQSRNEVRRRPGARLATVRWRRRGVVGLLALGGGLSLVRAARLVEPTGPRPGAEIEPLLRFLRAAIPEQDGYLYVLPTAFGSDTGTAPRLRYELFPRRYDDVRTDVGVAAVRDLMSSEGLRYVVVPDARQYPEGSWVRQPPDWLQPIAFDASSYVLRRIG